MAPNPTKILVVDDDPDIVELLTYNLEKEGYLTRTAVNGRQAVEVAQEFVPDVILLDVMMPVLDGIAACRLLRAVPALQSTYILFLTARSEEFSEVAAFEAGADDYLTKPIKPRALLSRLAAALRRERPAAVSAPFSNVAVIEVGDIRIDRSAYTVTKDGRKLILPKKEFELLAFLAATPDRVFSRDELLNNIWGSDVFVLARTVDVHIRKVREKIGEENIRTIKGVGYKFNTD